MNKDHIETIRTLQPTFGLRFRTGTEYPSDDMCRRYRVLQQAFICQETGDIEWRDVPEYDEG